MLSNIWNLFLNWTKLFLSMFTLTHFDPSDTHWSALIHSDHFWPPLIHFDPFWSTLTHSNPFLPTLTNLHQARPYWSTLIHSDPLWPTLTIFNPLWSTLTHSDPFRSDLIHLNQHQHIQQKEICLKSLNLYNLYNYSSLCYDAMESDFTILYEG